MNIALSQYWVLCHILNVHIDMSKPVLKMQISSCIWARSGFQFTTQILRIHVSFNIPTCIFSYKLVRFCFPSCVTASQVEIKFFMHHLNKVGCTMHVNLICWSAICSMLYCILSIRMIQCQSPCYWQQTLSVSLYMNVLYQFCWASLLMPDMFV